MKKVSEFRPPEQDFLEDLKRSIEMTENKSATKSSNFYKPSSMNCIRNMYYTRTRKKQDENSSSYVMWGICNSGTDTHIRVQTAVQQMQDNGIDCEYVDVASFVKQRKLDHLKIVSKNGMETKLRDNVLNLSFMCDGIIRYKGHYYILELKTESSNKWYYRTNVDESHYTQATCYSMCLDLDEVLFIYINRDVFDMKSYLFTVTEDMKAKVVDLIERCDKYVEKLICPPKPNNLSKKTCDYCDYKTQCRKDGQ